MLREGGAQIQGRSAGFFNGALGVCFPIDFEWPWDFQVEKRLSLYREFQRQRDVILSSLFFSLAPSRSLTIDDLSAKRPETLLRPFCSLLSEGGECLRRCFTFSLRPMFLKR